MPTIGGRTKFVKVHVYIHGHIHVEFYVARNEVQLYIYIYIYVYVCLYIRSHEFAMNTLSLESWIPIFLPSAIYICMQLLL